MNKYSVIALILIILLVTGCGVPRSKTATEEIKEPEKTEELEISSQEESSPEPESKEPESEEEEEESSEESSQEIAIPDTNPANDKPLKEVEAVSDEKALSWLGGSIEEFESLDNTSIVWGPGYTSGETRPIDPVKLQDKYGGYSAYFLGPNVEEVYLSFDEGYEVGYTGQILDTLKERGVKAVFFVTLGYVKNSPDLVSRMIDEGHIIGNHSSTHPVGGMPTMAPTDIAKDIIYLHELVLENFGYTMNLFRAPEGTFSVRTLAVLDALGYKSIFWSFAHNDWNLDKQPELDVALENIVSRSHPGAIYLLHAVSSSNTTVLGDVITKLEEKGYRFSDWSSITN